MILRPYQQRAVDDVMSDTRPTCLVAPTGSGKTIMGCSVASRYQRVLWVAHRRELIQQATERLSSMLPAGWVGGTGALLAPVQVDTVQGLLARGRRPPADLVVLDECHHYAADEWRQLLCGYRDARIVGLTATPERQDGRPLGDLFSRLVVAAQYSDLLAEGHLVPCRVYQPPTALEGLALDPLEAWTSYGEGRLTFAFAPTIQMAEEQAQRFRDSGISSATVTAGYRPPP